MRWIANMDDRKLVGQRASQKALRRAAELLGSAVVEYLEQMQPVYKGQIKVVYPEPSSGDLAWYLGGRNMSTDDEYLSRMKSAAYSFVEGYLKAKGK